MTKTKERVMPKAVGSGVLRHLPAILVLLALAIVQYSALALQNRALVGYDTLTYFYPNEQYAASALASGKLPLWNPYLFTGVPFLANMQTAVFYPLNLIFLLAPAPRAYALSIVLHVFLAGCFAYVFALHAVRLRPPAALSAAVVFALGGFLSAQSGHLNQLQTSAWLPASLLAADWAYRTRAAKVALAGSLVFAMQFLAGHTQEFYYSCIAVAMLLAWHACRDSRSLAWARLSRAARGIGIAGSMLLLAAGLVAIQLLPTYELAGQSIRSSGLSYEEASSFSLPPWLLLRTLLPAHGDAQPFSEWISYVGVASMMVAASAIWRKKRHPMALFFLLLVGAGFVLALGQFNPAYPLIYRWLPGLDLFRVPARWLLLFTFGMAGLTAIGIQELSAGTERTKRAIVRVLACAGTLVAIGLVLALLAVKLNPRGIAELPSGRTMAISAAVLIASGFAIALARGKRRSVCTVLLMAIVAGELLLAGRASDATRANLPEAVSSLRPAIAHLLAQPGVFRVLPFSEGTFDPGDLAEMKAMLDPVLDKEAIYDYVVAAKHKETLTPNLPLQFRIPSLDGYDGGLLPLRSYVELKNALGMAKGKSDSRLREDISSVPPVDVLSWLNVKYVLTDRVRDAWIDGVYYDLGLTRLVDSGTSWEIGKAPELQATSVGVISHLEQASSVAHGTPVAEATITLDSGTMVTTTLRAGVDTSEGRYSAAQRPLHQQARQAKAWRGEPDAWDYVTIVRLPKADGVRGIRFAALGGAGVFALRGVSVVDDRRGMSYPVPIDPALTISHLGDVKIYENERVLPRAFLVHEVLRVNGEAEALEAMSKPSFDPALHAIVSGGRELFSPSGSAAIGGDRDAVAITVYEAEDIAVTTESPWEGLLVLTDSYYPGWQATLDGELVEILRTDHLFRGVKVPPGAHSVEFRYEPSSLRLGAVVSLLALVFVIGGLAVTTRRSQ